MMNEEPMQDKPQDLSMKTARRVKPIPPPLDLNARTLDQEASSSSPDSGGGHLRASKSPAELLPRECLPIRKRPLLEVRRDLQGTKSPKSAGPNGFTHAFTTIDFRHVNTAPSSPLGMHMHPRIPIASTLSLTPSSASSLASVNSAFTHFPVPPPLIPTSHYSHMPKSPFLTTVHAGGNGFPTPPTDLHSPYPWPSPTLSASMFSSPFSPHSPLPFPTTALLSPASSSYPSSTNSSREDIPIERAAMAEREAESKRRFMSKTLAAAAAADSSSPVPSSPLLSPRTWSHSWPNPAWQCFEKGTMIRFVIPDLDTPWQKAEDLGWKDKIAMKVDAMNTYQYAPNGLTIVKIDVISRETFPPPQSSRPPASSPATDCYGAADRYGSAFTPISSASSCTSGLELSSVKKEPSSISTGEVVQTYLRLRMAPHRGDNSTEILAECSLDHPFFVKEKGWCSVQPRLTVEKYGIPSQDLSAGDVCLPPNHPDAVRTPDLCDRFRRFEFDDPASPLRPRQDHGRQGGGGGGGGSGPARKALLSPPPISPSASAASKKKEKDPDKPKRPMNGFMLFAKKYRLELIQQHPGKDNRAISVLLGEAWKSLPQEDREQYSQRAKVLADEQKKLFPDCWKRKRTLTSAAGAQPQLTVLSQQQQQLASSSSPTSATQPALPLRMPAGQQPAFASHQPVVSFSGRMPASMSGFMPSASAAVGRHMQLPLQPARPAAAQQSGMMGK